MRVVFVSPEYPESPPKPNTGGLAANTWIIARGLARRGVETCVVTRSEDGETSSTREEGVLVERLAGRWFGNRSLERLYRIRHTAAVARRFRPDIVQAAEWEADGWWLARWSKVPLITRLATPTYLVEELNREPSGRSNRLLHRLERDQTIRSDAVMAPTHAIADRVSRDWGLDKRRMSVIPCAIEVERMRRVASTEPPVQLPKRFLVFVGRLERRKGVEVLAEALPRVLAAHPDLFVLFIGGESNREVKERVQRLLSPMRDQVVFAGEFTRLAALSIVARAEIVVLPSLWEAFGNAGLEAMTLGRPVIATLSSGFSDYIEHERTGWLVPPGEVDPLAQRLLECLVDKESLRRVGEEAARAAERYDVENVAGEVLSLYELVLSKKSSG